MSPLDVMHYAHDQDPSEACRSSTPRLPNCRRLPSSCVYSSTFRLFSPPVGRIGAVPEVGPRSAARRCPRWPTCSQPNDVECGDRHESRCQPAQRPQRSPWRPPRQPCPAAIICSSYTPRSVDRRLPLFELTATWLRRFPSSAGVPIRPRDRALLALDGSCLELYFLVVRRLDLDPPEA